MTLGRYNLTAKANTTVRIVGKSGAGKSTSMDLLLRLLEPQIGTFSVDGVVITGDNVGSWQQSIGYVPQSIYLTDSILAENMALGVAIYDSDMSEVERASRAAQLHDFVISELDQGYETVVRDRGVRPSGGQQQRVGIARALYFDAPVLFLEEANSALDYEMERAFYGAVE